MKYVIVSKQELTQGFLILDKMERVRLKYKLINGLFISGYGSFNNPKGEIQSISSTLCARCYKGFDNFGMTGVIEIEEDCSQHNEYSEYKG